MRNLFKRRIISLVLVALVLLLNNSCDQDQLLDIKNTNDLNPDLIGEDPEVAISLLNGAYSVLQHTGLYGRLGHWTEDHMSDELQPFTNAGDPDLFQVSNYTLTPTSTASTLYFTLCYQGIARCNTLINRSSDFTFEPELTNALVGEARFIRGFFYFMLITRFEKIPIQLGLDPADKPLSSADEVYELIYDDLTFAAENLPGKGQQETGRPTNESAYGYLGKAYLFRQQYQEAMDALNQVTSYSLVPNYIDNFTASGEYNDESLFEVGFERAVGTLDEAWSSNAGSGNDEISFRSADYSGWSNSVPTEKLVNEYETNDPRFTDSWFSEGDTYGSSGRIWGVDGETGSFGFSGPNPVPDGETKPFTTKKYSDYLENDEHAQEGGVNPRLLRFADVLLMKAEAELFRPGGSIITAVGFLNEVRNRPSVMMPNYGTAEMNAIYPVGTTEEVFEAIIHERMIELALEGKRLLDLQRWNLDLQELPSEKSNYTLEKRYFPIPQVELDANGQINAGG